MLLKKNKIEVVAEIGMTHDGSIGLAKMMTISAAKSGATIIKYQWHIAEEETIVNAPMPPYFSAEPRFTYFKRTEFSKIQWGELVDLCMKLDVIPCVSVFSAKSALDAKSVGFKVIKIPSGEVSNTPLLKVINDLGLPVILSSGMSTWAELDVAIKVLSNVPLLCLLQCTSMYPTPSNKVGFNIMLDMQDKYQMPVGLSDHTEGGATSLAAVALGAKIIEKHFTLSKEMYGPDARFSLTPEEFRVLVSDVNYIHDAISSKVDKDDLSDFYQMRQVFQKSIVVKTPLVCGEIITLENICIKKPGTGIPASQLDKVIGMKVAKNLSPEHVLQYSDLQES